MYETQLDRLSNEAFVQNEIQLTINTLYAAGCLTFEQREELITLARSKANVSNETNENDKLLEFDARLRALEARIAALENGGEGTGGEGESPEEYVVGKWYYAGDRITYKSTVYQCIAPNGVVCVWSPDDYPAYWEAV